MKHLGAKICIALALISCLITGAGAGGTAEPNAEELRVPISLEVDIAIAGAEFEAVYTDGLTLVRFEPSEAIRGASMTPLAERNGRLFFGFYDSANNYTPTDGVLYAGNLVFTTDGSAGQSVTINEAKYVEVIDKDNTRSQIITYFDNVLIPMSGVPDPQKPNAPKGGASGAAAEPVTGSPWMIILIVILAVLLVAAGVVIIMMRRKKMVPLGPAEPLAEPEDDSPDN